jgi:pilus assembly protein CpaB
VYRLILLRVQSPAHTVVTTNKLMVAARDLQVGELIKDYDLSEVPWPGSAPEHAIMKRQDAVNRGVIANIYKNEPILDTRLAPQGAGAGLAATIPVGMRAVALPVNEVVGLAGFVLPGVRVDVLIAGSPPGQSNQGGMQCRTVLQNIEVLSAGQRIEKNVEGKPESAQVVNLLVTPDQAEVLNLASGETKVQLVLRNPLDTKEQPTPGTSLASLFGENVAVMSPVAAARLVTPRPAPSARRVPESATVEVFNGSKRSEQKLPLP